MQPSPALKVNPHNIKKAYFTCFRTQILVVGGFTENRSHGIGPIILVSNLYILCSNDSSYLVQIIKVGSILVSLMSVLGHNNDTKNIYSK